MADRGENVGKMRSMKPLESFGIGRLIADADFRIIEISEPSARLLGAEPEELLSKQLSVDVGPRREILEEALNGKIHLAECRTADGNTSNVCFRVMKINGRDSEGYDVIFLKESSELKCSGGESAHFNEVVHELEYNHAQTRFLEKLFESTGHDLKTPLGVILGYCELLFKGKANSSGAEQERIHRTIYKNCAWISEMVERIEEFSSTVRRCKEEKRQPVNFAGSLRDTAAKLCRTSFESQIKLNIEGPDSVEVMGAPSLFAILSDELLKNAILYCRKEREIPVVISQAGGKARAVIGIPALEEEMPSINHIVERVFIQPPDFHKELRETKPMCLGLGGVKYLVLMMGGTLAFTEGPGEGAEIVVEFPAPDL